MRISSLVSALYELSASFKDEFKNAGGAKHWLCDHSDKFIVDTDCTPGQELVTLRHHVLCAAAAPEVGEYVDMRNAPSVVRGVHALDTPATAKSFLMSLEGPAKSGIARTSHSEGSDEPEPAMPSPGEALKFRSLSFGDDMDFNEGLYPFSWKCSQRSTADVGDDISAALLIGVASEESTNDPILIEKKIRAVQKKLRRVHVIEELVAQGSSLDPGQQVLFLKVALNVSSLLSCAIIVDDVLSLSTTRST